MNLFLGSFIDTLRDWWNRFTHAIHSMNPTVRFVIVGVLAMIALACLASFIRPSYATDRHKLRIWTLVFGVLFAGLAIFFGTI